ncbi:MAG: ABC transporter permease [Leptothrix sp. (in: Bacteria)]|jgi:putative ABC transport system permease protein|nr:ABC transporter permease [Leptothrix sp. (in: b-proteobacteria)]HQY08135.1 ABC transporter permease [Burkholderiaceae bacterium]
MKTALLLSIAWRSAWHRRFGLGLVLVSVALSCFLLLAVERLRHDLRDSFSQAVSGTDLIVGPRSGSVQLLLYSVFRIGQASHNIRWESVQALQRDPAVAWVLPISLGDSHRGFPVVATTPAYFEHFRHGRREPLHLAQGRPFGDGPQALFEVVLGAEVAARRGYRLGERLLLAHGAGEIESDAHDEHPFQVVGVLARTGTPVDRSLHIRLEAMEALHQGGGPGGLGMPGLPGTAGMPGMAGLTGFGQPAEAPGAASGPASGAMSSPGSEAALPNLEALTPRSVTAALVGLKRRSAVFSAQRRIADYRGEPLLAILPGVALDELWVAVDFGERALLATGALVALVSLAGLVAVIVTGLEQRRHELAVLRSVGARPRQIAALLLLEGSGLTAVGALLGTAAALACAHLAGPWVQSQWGLTLSTAWPSPEEWTLLAAVVTAGSIASLLPGWRAYRVSLADGLTPPA